jgi:cobalt-zinc-cadmium efflux system outer membrane protein
VKIILSCSILALASSALPPPCAAEAAACAGSLDREQLVRCVLEASPDVMARRHALEAARGRELAESPLLPSNPTLSLTAARRARDRERSFNWSATLAQELEIAGQRGLRRASAHAEGEAEHARLLAARRALAAEALLAFFEVLSAREQERLSLELSASAQAVATAARERASSGVIAPIDADLADAAAVRVLQQQLTAARRASAAEATLAALLGRDSAAPALELRGALTPLAAVERLAPNARALNASPQLRALRAEQRAQELRADAYRRARVPNPTISLFAQDEGFEGQVLGAGLAFPIPLPGEVGRYYNGEIAEAEALARERASERSGVVRALKLAQVIARRDYSSRAKELAAFTPERLARAHQSLEALRREVESGRMAVRDAVVAQQALIELLQAHVAARTALCVASVELARAAGLPLERGLP